MGDASSSDATGRPGADVGRKETRFYRQQCSQALQAWNWQQWREGLGVRFLGVFKEGCGTPVLLQPADGRQPCAGPAVAGGHAPGVLNTRNVGQASLAPWAPGRQLPARTPWDGWGRWVPAALMWETGTRLLAAAWPRSSCCAHLGSQLQMGRTPRCGRAAGEGPPRLLGSWGSSAGGRLTLASALVFLCRLPSLWVWVPLLCGHLSLTLGPSLTQ